jgi:hypothetical protein
MEVLTFDDQFIADLAADNQNDNLVPDKPRDRP